jgi:hypothetical protein
VLFNLETEQIVGRERRERVSQLTRCGEGYFDSRRRVNSTVMRFLSQRESSILKRCASWFFVVVGVVGVIISYWSIYILVAYFAAGLVLWAELALLISGPIGAGAASLAWFKPRQRIAMTIGLLVFAAWLLLWILMFTVLGFRYDA